MDTLINHLPNNPYIKVTGCLSDLFNCWTDMVLLCRKASLRPRKGLLLFWGRVIYSPKRNRHQQTIFFLSHLKLKWKESWVSTFSPPPVITSETSRGVAANVLIFVEYSSAPRDTSCVKTAKKILPWFTVHSAGIFSHSLKNFLWIFP